MSTFDRSLYPFAPHHFDVGGGVRMHYVDEGPKVPAGTVLMVHGNPSWSFLWRDLIKALSPTHRCLAPDHVGMGLSDKPGDDRYDYTLARRVEDLGKLIEAARVTGPITLVAHDWGGMIGMACAAQHPGLVSRLVLLNTAAFPMPAAKKLPWQLKLTRTPVGTALVRGLNAFAWGATVFGMTRRKMSPAVQQGYLAPYDGWGARISTLRFVQDIPLVPGARGYDVVKATADRLPMFRDVPTYIGWGDRDFVFDQPFLDDWKRYLPHAQIRQIPEAGHYVLEDAGDILIPEIVSFIRG